MLPSTINWPYNSVNVCMCVHVCVSQQRRKSTRTVISFASTPGHLQKHTEKEVNVVMIGPHFRIGRRIGRGSFGEVRLGNVAHLYVVNIHYNKSSK